MVCPPGRASTKEHPIRWYIRGAWGLLIVSIVAWPVSQFTFARDEPPFVLGLSWLAIVLTCLDVLVTAKVKRDTGEESDP